MEPYEIISLVAIGMLGGVWNAVAGGATLFTFPALMAVGLPPVVANATNYLALLPSNAAALPAYRKELQAVGPALWPLMFVSGLGAIAGSLLLLVSDPSVFEVLIPFLIFMATLLFAFGEPLRTRLMSLAGGKSTGITVLAIAQIMGYSDFHVANGIKNLLATSFTILSIIVFGVGGLINWPAAIAMMAGAVFGGVFGGYAAKLVNQTYLRAFVILFGLVLSGVYFYRTYV